MNKIYCFVLRLESIFDWRSTEGGALAFHQGDEGVQVQGAAPNAEVDGIEIPPVTDGNFGARLGE